MAFRVDFDYFDDREEDVNEEHRRRVQYNVNFLLSIRLLNNPFAVSIPEFKRTFRIPQHLVMELCGVLAPFMNSRMHNLHFIPLEIKVLCALAFYASGSYQRVVGKMSDVSVCQASVSNAVAEVTAAFNQERVLRRYIRFPVTHAAREFTIRRNEQAGMPRVLGFIDGTLIKIVPPPRHMAQEVYYCRKGFTALNVQIVCDSDLYIMDINARFPGSTCDPYIYEHSGIRDVMEQAYRETRCWLLGDSIYPLQPWLHTPIPHAEPGTPEFAYTKLHCRCRNPVERCNGVFKERWRCCLGDRTLHYRPVKAGRIINACAVLHNFCILNNVNDPELERDPRRDSDDEIFSDDDDDDHDDGGDEVVEGVQPPAVEARARLMEEALAERQFLINYANNRGEQ